MRNSCTYKQAGTKTFRLSSEMILRRKILSDGKSKRRGWGSNLQNIEKSMREMYIPDDGKIFVQVDQSGAEALIVAYLSRAGKFRTLFENNVKPHVYVALRLFKDVWRTKMREHRIISATDDFDIDELIETPIPELKTNPMWKPLENIIKDSDNWSLQERYYYLAKQTCHCVDGQTEVLTRDGWVTACSYIGQQLAVVSDDRTIKFETPAHWTSSAYNGRMILLEGDETCQFVTPNHRVVYNTNKKDRIGLAANILGMERINIPTSGHYIGGPLHLPLWQIKLLAAIQADGYWYANGTVRFRFSKTRKVERLAAIIKEGNLDYTDSEKDVYECTIRNIQHITKYFGEEKLWGPWLLNFSKENLETLVNELSYWDGSYISEDLHKREYYCTKYEQNAQWIKTVCHLIGKQGTITKEKDVYRVGINKRQRSIIRVKMVDDNWQGIVYCPSVSTGKFLIRRKGVISVTGNSGNYGIGGNTFRLNVLEKSGGKIVISKQQADLFLLTYQTLFPEIFEWHREVQRLVQQHNMLFNLHGHPYTITTHKIEEGWWKELFSWVPQSTVGEITNIAYAYMQNFIETSSSSTGVGRVGPVYPRVDEALQRFNYRAVAVDMLANTHDSFLAQCPIDEEAQLAPVMKFFMAQTFTSPVDGVQFTMKSEAAAGFNWNNRKITVDKQGNEIVINPKGLKEIK